jgi:hypothetical protein
MLGLPLTVPHPSLQIFQRHRILLHELKRDKDGTCAVAADKQLRLIAPVRLGPPAHTRSSSC